MAFIYAVVGNESAVFAAKENLENLFDVTCCNQGRRTHQNSFEGWELKTAPACSNTHLATGFRINTPYKADVSSLVLCSAPKIQGPDQEPCPGWCTEIVLSIGVLMANIANKAPNPGAKTTIAILQHRALECYAAGGLWKACVGPLAEKWQAWNHKWKVLHIPPDPAWD